MRKTLDLAAAVAAAGGHAATELTLSELVSACAISLLDGSDLRLRKWTAAFGHESTWSITSETLEIAAHAMIESGYKPSTANRDLSSLGSVYRWARDRRLSPRGFRSPTLGVRRFEEGVRRVEVPKQLLEALRARSLGFRDRRFGVFVALLIDTGARKSCACTPHNPRRRCAVCARLVCVSNCWSTRQFKCLDCAGSAPASSRRDGAGESLKSMRSTLGPRKRCHWCKALMKFPVNSNWVSCKCPSCGAMNY